MPRAVLSGLIAASIVKVTLMLLSRCWVKPARHLFCILAISTQHTLILLNAPKSIILVLCTCHLEQGVGHNS